MTPTNNETRPTLAGTQAGLDSQEKGATLMSHKSIVTDAREFGLHVKQGGWRLGLLVARNVDYAGNGRPSNAKLRDREVSGKVSADGFATESDTSADRVLRYLKAWNKAADAGLVPHSDDLHPGDELDQIDFDAINWNSYYTGAAGPFRIKDEDRREALISMAENDGVGPGKVQEIAANPNALVSAIKADPATAQAAANALAYADPSVQRNAFERLARNPEVSSSAATRISVSDSLDKARRDSGFGVRGARADERTEAERKSRGDLRALSADADLIGAKRKIRSAMNEIHEANLSTEDRELLHERVGELARMLDLLRAEIDGTASVDWDAELASLMGGE